jgi:hypothetical protein
MLSGCAAGLSGSLAIYISVGKNAVNMWQQYGGYLMMLMQDI